MLSKCKGHKKGRFQWACVWLEFVSLWLPYQKSVGDNKDNLLDMGAVVAVSQYCRRERCCCVFVNLWLWLLLLTMSVVPDRDVFCLPIVGRWNDVEIRVSF